MPPAPPVPADHAPDNQVATFITQELLAEDLIAEAQFGDLLRGLASGRLKAEDWRRIAQDALAMEARRGNSSY